MDSEVSTVNGQRNEEAKEKDQAQYTTQPYNEKEGVVGSDSGQSITQTIHVPDGGFRAWLVVAGCFIDLFSSFGLMNSYGVFQEHYTSTLLTKTSPSIISLIGSFQLFLSYALSPLVGRIFDAYGPRELILLGTILITISMMLLSVCQKDHLYQFFLCHGVLFGLADALVFTPALACVGHWFKRKRGYALGLVAAGSGLGGLVYPILLQQLIIKIGFPWAVRVAGFLTFACLIFSCLTMRTYLPLKRRVSLRDAVDLRGFLDIRYCLAALGAFFGFYALFIPYYYIGVYGNFEGVDPGLSKYLISILNGMGIPARILPGLLADRFGPLNVLIPTMSLCTLWVFALWLPSRSPSTISAFAALYGLFSGGFLSLLPSYIAIISPVEKFGARLGSIYLVAAVATLIGTPTAGAFLDRTNQNAADQSHFNRLIIFTGALLVACTLSMVAARFVHSRKLRQKV
ncbi:MFS general substrate transporter [Panus rudis PR-1116 ss-1]|nr:MFS general substrate transporter [Panus rudis PR-1116 ss-1]